MTWGSEPTSLSTPIPRAINKGPARVLGAQSILAPPFSYFPSSKHRSARATASTTPIASPNTTDISGFSSPGSPTGVSLRLWHHEHPPSSPRLNRPRLLFLSNSRWPKENCPLVSRGSFTKAGWAQPRGWAHPAAFLSAGEERRSQPGVSRRAPGSATPRPPLEMATSNPVRAVMTATFDHRHWGGGQLRGVLNPTVFAVALAHRVSTKKGEIEQLRSARLMI